LVSFINDQRWQYFIVQFRLSKPIDYLCSTEIVSKFLNSTGLRQDVFLEEETHCEKLYVDYKKCNYCGKCKKYCPIGLDLPGKIGDVKSGCFKCLYCFLVCPEEAIKFEGTLGFLEEQIKQYNKITKEIV
jgi:ferredoxin